MTPRTCTKPASESPVSPAQVRLSRGNRALRAHKAQPEKKDKWLAALSAISGLIARSSDIDQVLDIAADKTMEVMDVDALLLFLVDETAQELVLKVSRGVSKEFVEGLEGMRVWEGFNGAAARTGRPLVVEDAVTDPLLTRHVVVSEGIRSQLIVPLQSSASVLGTLCVARRSRAEFDADEIALLGSIGNAIGATLGNAYLHHDREQALTKLRQSEEKYRGLFEKAYDAIWLHDLQGNTLAANEACEKLTGYRVEELMKQNICQMMSESSRSCVDVIEQRLLSRESVDHRCEGEIVKKNGDKAIIQVSTTLVTREDRPAGFQHCARDVTEERKLEESLQYYLQQITRAQEEERKRISRELHDDIMQRLIALSRQLDKITSSDALWEESLQTVRSFQKQIELAVKEVRRFSRDLRPSILDELGLLPALELLADDLEKQGVVTGFKVLGKARRLVPDAEVMLFRIAQEAVTNIWKHAKASAADLTIQFFETKVTLHVRDNGIGFRPTPAAAERTKSGGLGIIGMRERARLLGGSVEIQSRAGNGTQVTVEVPTDVVAAHGR